MHTRRPLYHLSLVVFALVLTGCGLFGTSLPDFTVSYSLEGVPSAAPESIAGTTSRNVIEVLPLTRGAGIQPSNLTNAFSSSGWNRPDPSLEVALAEELYYQFGFRVEEGFTVSLSALDLWLRRSAPTAPSNFQLRVSFDGFTTHSETLANFNYYGYTTGSPPDPNPVGQDPFYYMKNELPGRPNQTRSVGDPIPTVDLTGFDFLQDIPGGTTVTFRLYAWGTHDTAPSNTLALGRMHGPRIKGFVVAEE